MSWQPVWITLAAAVPTIAGAYLVNKRGKKTDEATIKSGVAANGRAGVAQEFEILRLTLASVREDYAANRALTRERDEQLAVCADRVEAMAYKLDRYYFLYGPLPGPDQPMKEGK